MGGSGGGVRVGRPLLTASAAFLAGAYFGCVVSVWPALCVMALGCALVRPARFAAIGLLLGLLRGGLLDRPAPFALSGEFEGTAVSPGVVRVRQGLAALRVRGDLHRGDRAIFFGNAHEPPGRLNPGGRDRRAALSARGIAVE